ncbi:MAG: glutamyl-tRNA reductase [Clostridiaceae bacterium]
MIGVIGIRNNIKLDIREKLSIIPKRYEEYLLKLNEICDEVLILSTCNRTEVYFSTEKDYAQIIDEIFERLNWSKEYIKYIFFHKDDEAVDYIMNVVCGFYSSILGEDQILGQVKDAYEIALKNKTIKKEIQKLFQMSITCGKEFRFKSRLYTIPVSSASISVNEGRRLGARNFMVLGYGEIGSLACKYIMSGSFNKLYIALRNPSLVEIEDSRVKAISFNERQKFYKDVDCIICSTSAPHPVVHKNDLPEKELVIFDLAVPRDVEEGIEKVDNIQVYDIDKISLLNDENCQKRKLQMEENKYILDNYINDFKDWQKIREISPQIEKLKECGEVVYRKRYKTFKNKSKTKDKEMLAEMLLKSTSDAYVNRAIEVLKEEQLKGRYEECLNIIQRIFYNTK